MLLTFSLASFNFYSYYDSPFSAGLTVSDCFFASVRNCKDLLMKMLTGNLFRIIYAVIFSIIGINHFINASEFAKYFPTYVPDRKEIVFLIGFILIGSSIFILLNKFVKPICISLSIFLLVVVFAIHLPGLLNIEIMKISMFNVLKDTGLAGGGLLIAGFFDISEHQ